MPQKIKDRISVLLEKTGKTASKLEKEAGIGNQTIKGWLDKELTWSSASLEKFLTHFRINHEWWINGRGDVFVTDKDKTEFNVETLYKDLVEANSDYRLVPKTILDEEYRIVLKSELEEKAQLWRDALSAKNALIEQLNKEILKLESSSSKVHAQKAQ